MIIMYSDGICVMSNTYNTFEKVWFCDIHDAFMTKNCQKWLHLIWSWTPNGMYPDVVCVMSNTHDALEKVCLVCDPWCDAYLDWKLSYYFDFTLFEDENQMGCTLMWFVLYQIPMMHWNRWCVVALPTVPILTKTWAIILTSPYLKLKIRRDVPWCGLCYAFKKVFFFFFFFDTMILSWLKIELIIWLHLIWCWTLNGMYPDVVCVMSNAHEHLERVCVVCDPWCDAYLDWKLSYYFDFTLFEVEIQFPKSFFSQPS